MFEKGTINRPHGVHGEVVVKTLDNQPLELDQVYYLKNQRGDFNPIRVEKQKVSNKGNEILFFVLFTGITNRQLAENLKNEAIYSTNPILVEEDEDVDSIFDTIDFKIVDLDGTNWGSVIDVTETPAHAILIIEYLENQYMIPAVEEHIKEIDFDLEVITAFDPKEFAEL